MYMAETEVEVHSLLLLDALEFPVELLFGVLAVAAE